eukprot:1997670-Rhodomonas_salina.1
MAVFEGVTTCRGAEKRLGARVTVGAGELVYGGNQPINPESSTTTPTPCPMKPKPKWNTCGEGRLASGEVSRLLAQCSPRPKTLSHNPLTPISYSLNPNPIHT